MNLSVFRRLVALGAALCGLTLARGQVLINEFAAATSDRLLLREPGAYPRVGNTVPWQSPAFDDSRWSAGASPLGFGTFTGLTLGTDLSASLLYRGVSVYARRAFVVSQEQATSGATLELLVRYNDGFIAFLNGVEVARRNLGPPGLFAPHDFTAFNTNAPTPGWAVLSLGQASTRLTPGTNYLCLQAHNQSLVGVPGANLLLEAQLRLAGGAVLVAPAATWKYFPGLAEPSGGVVDHGLLRAFVQANSGVTWAKLTFNDAAWPVGPGPVGIEGTNPPDYLLGVNLYAQAYGVTPSIYTRRVFTLSPAEAASDSPLRLTLDYDDGVIVYLNGREVARRNVGTPGVPTPFDAFATAQHNANGDNNGDVTGQAETLLLDAPKNLVLSGDNVLAVQLHRASLTSSDAVARVTLETTGPGGRTLCQPSDTVSCFLGLQEPVIASEQDNWGALDEPPDTDNDWIELHNPGLAPVNLAGWSLTDNAGNLRKWSFPADTTIAAGGYLLVLATGLDTGPADGATYLHSNFKLSADGEYLGLVNAAGQVVSEFAPAFPPQSYFHSYGRATNGVWGHLSVATPGGPNLGPALVSAPAAPEFSEPGGFRIGTVSLVLTSRTAGASIRYTLDGSEPAPGLLYTAPLTITSDRVVRARAVREGAIPSATVTRTYLMNATTAKRTLPVLCLAGDPALTFYGPNASGGPTNGTGLLAIRGGLYVNDMWSANGDPAAFHFPRQYGRGAELPASLEYYPQTGAPLLTDFGLRLSGSQWSRPRYRLTDAPTSRFNPTDPTQKPSFNLYFRSEWSERPLDYPFFTNYPVTRFQDVRLRAGKNDIANPFLTDELVRRLFLGMGQQGSLGSFTTVYLNAVFKGYFNLCEHLREGFMQAHHGGTEAWDVQQVNEFSSGDPLHWNQTLAYLRATNLATLAAYQRVHEALDVDNFIDYLALNTFAATWDWPHNNWVTARERSAQGRWRFYVWDAEGAFGIYGRPTSYNSFTSDLVATNLQATWNPLPILYSTLRASPEFRLRFSDRVQRHFFNGGCLVRTNLMAAYARLRNQISPILLETLGENVNDTLYNTWLANDNRRTTYFTQLSQQGLWPATLAPAFSHYGGTVGAGWPVMLTNPNGAGTIYYSTNGVDPRAPGGAVAGRIYLAPIIVSQTMLVQARVLSPAGVWSPVVEARYVVPPPAPTFLPTGSGDWTTNANWSTAPLAYPEGVGAAAIIPPPAATDRNVNLSAPVTIGQVQFPQADSTVRQRLRDLDTGNTLTFQTSNGPARLEVGGTGTGYVELEVLAGAVLGSDLQLHITNLTGHADYGALRLRANWSGPGGLLKSGPGIASLTGDAKTYSGVTRIAEGVLQVTDPATPTASTALSVEPGGQLRLLSGGTASAPRRYAFGGPLTLAGAGRGPEIPDLASQGKSGALRFAPGGNDLHASLSNALILAGPATLHVEGASNSLTLAGPLTGAGPLTQTGNGTLRFAADQADFTAPLHVEQGTLALAAALGSPVTLASGATLTGYGSAGALAGAGAVWLDQTLLRAPSVTGLTGQFGFHRSGSPVYSVAASAGNGVLLLGGAPASMAGLEFYLPVSGVPAGTVFRGGLWVPFPVNLAAALAGVPRRVFVPDAAGLHSFAGRNWSLLTTAQVTTVPELATFPTGAEPGRIVEVRVGGGPVTFAAWRGRQWTNTSDLANPLVSGPSADPTGAGLPNLLRYALGLTLADSPAVGRPRFAGTPAAPGITFPFDAGRNDIACVVEATPDLADWTAPTVLFDSRTDFPPAIVAGWLTVSDPAPSGARRFYRLRVIPLDGL